VAGLVVVVRQTVQVMVLAAEVAGLENNYSTFQLF
jgi:hypothetical protein